MKIHALLIFAILLPIIIFFVGRYDIDYLFVKISPPDPKENCESAKVLDLYHDKSLYSKYTVRKGDTILSIAKNQLGDTSWAPTIVNINFEAFSGKENYPTDEVPELSPGETLYLPPKFLEVEGSPPSSIRGEKGIITSQTDDYLVIGDNRGFTYQFEKSPKIKSFGKKDFHEGDCVALIVSSDNGSILAISPQDKNYFSD